MARRPKRGAFHPAARGLILVLVLLLAWGVGLVRFADSLPSTVADTTTKTDAIVVLTGGSGRLDKGLDLLAAGAAEHLFISGVYRGLDVRRLLELSEPDRKDLQGRINIGNAVNTVENAEETAKWMRAHDFTSLRLVTGAYHMPRSLIEFENALPGAHIIPHPVFPEHVKQKRWWVWPGTASLIVGEYNKTLVAWLRHRVEHLLVGKRRPEAP